MKHTLLALTLTASSAFAQQPAPPAAAPAAQLDARFAAWLGCWRLDDDLAGTGARMCITPEKHGVRLQTVAGTQRRIDEVVVPDAVAHAINDPDCKGTELAEWSKDGARMFRTTDVTCGTDAPRKIQSVAFMAPGPSWISVQHVEGAIASTAVRVQRYRRAANQQLADGSKAQQPPADLALRTTPEKTKWDVEDVIEASGKLPTEALQASLAELHQPFEMNKKTLIALDEGGVHDSVIDLMVALTYPKRFVVERAGGSSATGISTGTGWFDPFVNPMMMGAMMDCYAPYGYGYRSYYSMCGAPYYGYGLYGYNGYNYYNNGYYNGGWVVVPPINGGGSGTVTPQPEGRVVNGRGYTQIHDRQPEPTPRVSSGGANGSAAGWSGNSGGGVSSGGYSAGSSSSGSGGGSSSSGDSGARMAVPKGGGGR